MHVALGLYLHDEDHKKKQTNSLKSFFSVISIYNSQLNAATYLNTNLLRILILILTNLSSRTIFPITNQGKIEISK